MEPRFVADEMLGRLARYLRILGYDTIYARGLADDAIRELARREERILLTRDEALARRTPSSWLLGGSAVEEQLERLRMHYPELVREIRFRRCTLCNGELRVWRPASTEEMPDGSPRERVAAGLPLYRCERCRHLYWEGTHTAQIRARLSQSTARTASP